MSDDHDDDVCDEISRFDQDYIPDKGQGPGLDSVPDDTYELSITGVELTRTTEKRIPILRLLLQVTAGSRKGLAFEHVYFFDKQTKIDRLGGDLLTLGFDADRWTPRYNRRFSVELTKAVATMKGLRFLARKVSRKDTDNKLWHNLNLLTRLGSSPAAPSLPPAAPPAVPASSAPPLPPDDEDIPF